MFPWRTRSVLCKTKSGVIGPVDGVGDPLRVFLCYFWERRSSRRLGVFFRWTVATDFPVLSFARSSVKVINRLAIDNCLLLLTRVQQWVSKKKSWSIADWLTCHPIWRRWCSFLATLVTISRRRRRRSTSQRWQPGKQPRRRRTDLLFRAAL